MRVIVLGAGGMLGHDLVATAPEHVRAVALTRADLDITDRTAVAARLRELAPEVIINAAAYTAVDRAESDREATFRVNAEAVGELGSIARTLGSVVVHFSTDYVFDGEARAPYAEDAPANPINVYGASKLAGERALVDSGAEHLLIRTQWLFGLRGRSFPRTMWERATARQPTRVVNDQRGRPTFSPDLARATWVLLERGVRGLLHVANGGAATWYDVAAQVFRMAGTDSFLEPCSTAEYPTSARRPLSSILDLSRFESLGTEPLPSWQDALGRFLDQLSFKTGVPGWPASSAAKLNRGV
jgi:dTDP-4-dehydrorhamnose reductase